MGNEINTEFIKAKQTYADFLAGNKDGELKATEKEAIEVFKTAVVEAYGKGDINEATFNQAMGLYVSNPVATTQATETEKETESNPIDSNPRVAIENDLSSLVNEKVAYPHGSDVTLANIIEKLQNANTSSDYKKAIEEVSEVLEQINNYGFKSKAQIEHVNTLLLKSKKLNLFQKKYILPLLIQIANVEQINKEADELYGIYNDVVNSEDNKDEENPVVNYTARLEKVTKKMDDKYLTGMSFYSTDAYANLKASVKEEVETWAVQEMKKMISDGKDYTKKEDVKKALLAKLHEEDSFAKNVIKNFENDEALVARILKRDRTAEALETITLKEIKSELDRSTITLLNRNYLGTVYNKEKDTYDLTAISEAISSAVGADVLANPYDDFKASEKFAIKTALSKVVTRPVKDITDDMVKDLMGLCQIKNAPKDRSLATAFTDGIAKEATQGAIIGTILGFVDIEQVVNSNDALINIFVKNSIKIPMLASVPAATAAEILINGLVNMIFGKDVNEQTCFDYEAARGKSLDEFAQHIQNTETNKDKAKAIVLLAKVYEDHNPENWAEEFIADMEKAAGNKTLNCEEFKGYKYIEEDINTYNIYDKEAVAPTEVEVNHDTVDGRSSSWEALASQYGCIEGIEISPEYTNCIERRKELPTRILKVAQAITNNDYSSENLLKLAELTFASKDGTYSNLKDYPGIDYEILVKFMNGEVIGKVKTPAELAGCTIKKKPIAAVIENKSGTKPTGNPAQDKVIIDGSDAEYRARFNEGEWEYFGSDKTARDKAVEEFLKKHPKAIKMNESPFEEDK